MEIQITPVGKPRMTQRDRWAKRAPVVRYHAYCDELKLQLPGYNLPGELRIEFGIPMPKSWSKAKRERMDGQPHTSKPDIDNLAKAFMDAFKTDDSHVWHLDGDKYWAPDGYIVLN